MTTKSGTPAVRPLVEMRRLFPRLSEADADYLLWEQTCFPVGSWAETWKQLQEIATACGAPKRGWYRKLWIVCSERSEHFDAALQAAGEETRGQ